MRAVTDRLDALPSLRHDHNVRVPGTDHVVCARCGGLYGGLACWAVALAACGSCRAAIGGLPMGHGFALSFGLTLPLVADWWAQCRGLRHSTNPVRIVTGSLLALGAATLLVQYRYLHVFVPLAVGWAVCVIKLGTYWRIRRPPYWGCSACELGTVGEYIQRQLE
jgi:uncharacterized membrane protein